MKVDMSPEAITLRLRQVSELRRLCLALGNNRPVEGDRDATEKPGDAESQPPGDGIGRR